MSNEKPKATMQCGRCEQKCPCSLSSETLEKQEYRQVIITLTQYEKYFKNFYLTKFEKICQKHDLDFDCVLEKNNFCWSASDLAGFL